MVLLIMDVDEVAKANDRIRILLDKTPLAAWFWDSNRKIVDCNEAAVELFGFKDKEECLRRYSGLYSEYQPDGQLSVDKLNKCIEKAWVSGHFEFEWTYKLLDGAPLPSEVILVKLEYGDDYAMVGYTRDLREQIALIEEMRKAEIAEESNKAKSQFLANMSKEMRTPLNVIVGLCDLMLEEDKQNTDYKENLREIRTAGKTLLAQINNVLDISKIETGKLDDSYTEEKKIDKQKLVRADLSFAKVLVVDDMQTNLDVAKGLLGKYKMQVDCVLSGQEAIEQLRTEQQTYNAIFMDHMMPGMDGIETAKAIRNIEYAQNIPIIAMTANAIEGTEEMFYANGFQGFLTKPINIFHLDAITQKWIHNSEEKK